MHIERVQVEEGFLDGLDVQFVPGLNVIIGARGTGKTSLIELMRFCLDVRGYTPESGKRSRDHALSVLGAGQVILTLSDGVQRIIVTRTANDDQPRASAPFAQPIILSQTEIEAVGLHAGGRLQLLVSFTLHRGRSGADELEAISVVRSSTAEVEALRREIDEFGRQIAGLKDIDQAIASLAPAELQLATLSSEAGEKKKKLDAISISIASTSVAGATLERFNRAISQWRISLSAAANAALATATWPELAATDLSSTTLARIERARAQTQGAQVELSTAESEIAERAAAVAATKIIHENEARQLRKEIEELQAGAGTRSRRSGSTATSLTTARPGPT